MDGEPRMVEDSGLALGAREDTTGDGLGEELVGVMLGVVTGRLGVTGLGDGGAGMLGEREGSGSGVGSSLGQNGSHDHQLGLGLAGIVTIVVGTTWGGAAPATGGVVVPAGAGVGVAVVVLGVAVRLCVGVVVVPSGCG